MTDPVRASPPDSPSSTDFGSVNWDGAFALLRAAFGPDWRETATIAQIRELTRRVRAERARPAA